MLYSKCDCSKNVSVCVLTSCCKRCLKSDRNSMCVVVDVAGGCHSGAAASDARMSHHGTHQATSPNGFVSD